MNSKKIKKLRKRVKHIQVEWLKSILPEEQSVPITVDNVNDLLPDQTHTFGGGQVYLSYMSDKWILKQLKRNPTIKSYQDLISLRGDKNDERIFT